jgi:choline dehydrogenase
VREFGSFDHIVVGAGSAGCAVAARLSEDPARRVLLIESGPPDRNFWIHLPIGYYRTIVDPRVSRTFQTEPEPELDGRRINWPRGRVLGGSSSINGLAWVRGQAADFDHWRQLGNEGWSFADVLPFFKRLERYPGGDPELRGRDGPLAVSDPRHRMELLDAFVEAAVAAGIPRNPDYNGAVQDGVGYFQLSLDGRRRCSAARAYLGPARGRANLAILTGARTRRILLEDGRAAGIAFERGAGEELARAAGDIVLCAGAINSPQLLMVSGIGPADMLRAAGVEPVLDLPGVGMNLQDHLQIRAVYRCPRPITLNDVGNSLVRRVLAGLEWLLRGTGPLTVGAGVVALFWRTREEVATPDVQFHVIPFSADKPGATLHPFSGFTVSVCQLRPESRGSIAIRSPDAADEPVIRANYLATETDRRTMVDGLRLIRRVMAQEPIRAFVEQEVMPGPGCDGAQDLLAYIRAKATTIFHPCGTCRMGPEGEVMAVVDPRLRVRGLRGLRVADASIMPTVVSGNTNAPTIMIGEKAAAMIREDARAG